jgi:FolB domain-containing protein
MDQVFITNLVARGILGVNDWEREKPRDILINMALWVDLHTAGKSDDLTDCVNYATLAKKILAHAETAGRFTVEALATDLAQICLEDARVAKVRVRVDKPGAVPFAHSVGVEIERTHADLD